MSHLLVPREDALFIPSSGKLVPLEKRGFIFKHHTLPEMLSKPLTKSSGSLSHDTIIMGKHSGVRSGLVFNNGTMYRTMYKLKGCAPTTEDYAGEPYGGQVLSRVEQEIEATQALTRVLAKEGLPSPYRALGYFKYPLTFKGEPLACSIMEARGDTRLDELIFDLEKEVLVCYSMNGDRPKFPRYVDKLGDVFYKLGQWGGWLKRIMDDNNMPWSMSSLNGGRTNAHIGNYVVFLDNGELLLGVVDLDDCHFPFDNPELRENEFYTLVQNALDPVMTSMNIGFKLPNGVEYPQDYRWRFVEGFDHGYMNADAVRIQPDEIAEARKAALEAREKLREEMEAEASRVGRREREYKTTKSYIDSSKYLGDLNNYFRNFGYGKKLINNGDGDDIFNYGGINYIKNRRNSIDYKIY